MANLEVLDVGDGACSILSGETSVMVVDCGSGRTGRADHSAEILAQTLGARSASIDTVVITHFDADHWKGLWALPEKWAAPPTEVLIFYPYLLPSDAGLVQVAHLVMQSATAQTPVTAALDVVNAWKAAGVKVKARALVRGDMFRGGDSIWTVHWPPSHAAYLPGETGAIIEDLAAEIRRVASENRVFADAICTVQREWFDQDDGLDDVDRLGLDTAIEAVLPDRVEITAEEVISSLRGQLGSHGWTDLRARIRKYNNALSVVHTSDTVANFGDCEGVGLTALLRLQGIRPPTLAVAYPIVLAPHHGTQIPRRAVRKMFPYATRALVCQNGGPHYEKGLDDDIARFRQRVTGPFDTDIWHTYLRGSVMFPHA